MAKKFYVVWSGRETGIFTSWPHTKSLVDKYPQAKYKSFNTHAEAQAAYAAGAANKHSTPAQKYGRQKTANETKNPTPSDLPSTNKFDVLIYCDGACDPNPGKSSSGVAVYRNGILAELWYGLYNPHGTNNTAELNALYQAMLIGKKELQSGKSVHILCDSKYTINCITVWAFNWKKKGWKRNKEGDIKNLDIIQKSHDLYLSIKNDVVISHVKAHCGIEGNELADRMSVHGIDQHEKEFSRYSDPLDIDKILNLRNG